MRRAADDPHCNSSSSDGHGRRWSRVEASIIHGSTSRSQAVPCAAAALHCPRGEKREGREGSSGGRSVGLSPSTWRCVGSPTSVHKSNIYEPFICSASNGCECFLLKGARKKPKPLLPCWLWLPFRESVRENTQEKPQPEREEEEEEVEVLSRFAASD